MFKAVVSTQRYIRRWSEHGAFKTVKVKALFWLFNLLSTYILVVSEYLITVILLLKISYSASLSWLFCPFRFRDNSVRLSAGFPSLHLQKALYQFLEENALCYT